MQELTSINCTKDYSLLRKLSSPDRLFRKIFFLSNLFIYLFQHRALHYNLHYVHNFTYIIDKRVLKWTTLQYNI